MKENESKLQEILLVENVTNSRAISGGWGGNYLWIKGLSKDRDCNAWQTTEKGQGRDTNCQSKQAQAIPEMSGGPHTCQIENLFENHFQSSPALPSQLQKNETWPIKLLLGS